jgi:zinc transport system substrate-binding protein
MEMVESIGGEYVDVTVMVPEGKSPHSFEPTPEQMIKVAKATAYFKVGSGVEFEHVNMETIFEHNPELKVFDCSEDIMVISFDQHYGQEHFDVTENNHGYAETDPHIWTSPLNFKKMAEVVYNGLVEIDVTHKEDYNSSFQTYVSKLDKLHSDVIDLLQPHTGKSFMVYHPSWGYFGDEYNLKQIAIEDEGKQPGPAGVAAIIEQAKNESIKVIFVAPQYDTTSAETIASEIGCNVVIADPLMTEYTSTILQLVEDMVLGFENG